MPVRHPWAPPRPVPGTRGPQGLSPPRPWLCLQSPWSVWTHAGSGPLGLVISKCPRKGHQDCPWVWGWPLLLDPATSLGRCHGSSCPLGPTPIPPLARVPLSDPSRGPSARSPQQEPCPRLRVPVDLRWAPRAGGGGRGHMVHSIRHIFLQFADFHLLILAFLIFQRRRELLNLPVNLVPSSSPSSF